MDEITMTVARPRPRRFRILGITALVAVLIIGGVIVSRAVHHGVATAPLKAAAADGPTLEAPQAFVAEVYDIIQKNYWDKISDKDLSNLFLLGTNKAASASFSLTTPDKAGVMAITTQAMEKMDEAAKKKFATELSMLILVNLKPFARSSLYTEQEQKQLYDTVGNIDHSKDLYGDLGLEKGASPEKVEVAYKEKMEELKKDTSPEGKKKLEAVAYARDVLKNENTKKTYDTTGAEPTVFAKEIVPGVEYIRIAKISPQTFNEFIAVANGVADKPGLDSLIIDLRDNIGGAVDSMQYFLGPFIGAEQYAYEFFHQGDKTPFKTKYGLLPSLAKYKKIAVMINGKSQSSAEVMAGALKKYHIGVIVGTHSAGWGTIEQLIPITTRLDDSTKYSVLIVQSITLREDNQPVESRGIDVNVDLTKAGWQKELNDYFNEPGLTKAVESVWKTMPKYTN